MRLINLQTELKNIQKNTELELNKVKTLSQLKTLKRCVLGKGGKFNQLFKTVAKLSAKERTRLGRAINEAKSAIQIQIRQKQDLLTQLEQETFPLEDVTFPGQKFSAGHLHPISKVAQKAISVFEKMGFEIWEARLVDDRYHNYLSLNFPEGHPAMDTMDTLWVDENLLLITHTSSMQNRILRTSKPPIAAVALGKCFRREATDPIHEHTFHQLEGIFIGEKVSLPDLIGTLKSFLEAFFEKELKIKVQPSYFPFVEPGIEIMAECMFCSKQSRADCKTCGGKKWLELIPAGMVHPKVLKEAEINSQKYQGFAWAIGLDRLAMLAFGINDIRWFHSGDIRFLKQF